MLTYAVEGSIFYKAYKLKMTEESFSKKHHKAAMHDFMNEQNSAFYTFTDDIPKDILCKVLRIIWNVLGLFYHFCSYL